MSSILPKNIQNVLVNDMTTSTSIITPFISTSNLISNTATIPTIMMTGSFHATHTNNTIANIFTTGGNVGIGTTSPIYTLDVTGTCDVSTSITTAALFSTNITSTNIVGTNMTAGTLRFNNNGSGLIWGTNFSRIYDDGHLRIVTDDNLFFHTTNTTGCAMFIGTTNGNVGIGTTAPAHKLDVVGTIDATTYTGANIMISGSIGSLGSIDAGSQFLGQANDTIAAPSFSWTGDTNTGMYRPATDTLGFVTNGAERMRVSSSGNVGIGTTAPTTVLDIVNSSPLLQLRDTSGANGKIYFGNSSHGVGRNASIGTLTNGNDVTLWTNGGGASIGFATQLTERMRITDAGNVGIGTSAPGYKLHVSGDIYSSGDITAFSDIRLKENIVQLSGCLDKIDNIRGVSFNRIDTGSKHIGLIAQEVEAEFPQLVATDLNSGFKSINYGNVVAVLLECIRELKVEVNKINSRIAL